MKVAVSISTTREQEYVDGKTVWLNEADKDRATQSLNFTIVGYESADSLAPIAAVIMDWLQDKMASNPRKEAEKFLVRRNSEIQEKLKKIQDVGVNYAITDHKTKRPKKVK